MPKKHEKPGDAERRREVGERIRAARLEAGVGLRQLARELGMSSSWLNNVESGENGIDAVRLADIATHLGHPAGYFLDDQPAGGKRTRQLLSRPSTRIDWQLMYAGEEERARAHFELDRVFKRLEEERGGRVEGPAGGD